MAILPAIFVLRQQLSSLAKLGLTQHRTLQQYRRQGNRIRTETFNRYFKAYKDFETRKSDMINMPSTRRMKDEEYVISPAKMRMKYNHIFRTESWNNRTNQLEDKYFTLASSQRYTPGTALRHLRDKVETGDDKYGYIIERAWFEGGFKRGSRVF